MRAFIVAGLAMCTFSVLMLGFSTPAQAEEVLKVGDQAPKFDFLGSDGKTYRADDFLGKKALVIAWFPRAFTGGCTKECKSMKAAGDQLRKFNVAYFTASTDSVEKNAEFAKSLELDYPILCDPEGKNASMFGVLRPDGKTASRVTFIITKDGKIASIDNEVKTESHGEDLVKKLKKLNVEAAE